MTNKNKYYIGGGVAVAVVAIGILAWLFWGQGSPANLVSVTVKSGDITEKINLTGQVKSSQGVDLAFVTPGKVVANYVKVGDKIYAGQTLAVLDQSSARSALTIAQGSLAQAQANYNKLLAGATQQNVKTVQDSINSAQQNLTNAYSGATNTVNNSYTAIYNAYNVAVNIQNSYFTTQDPQGIAFSTAKNDINSNMQTVQISSVSDATISQTILSLNNVYNDVNIIRAQCDQGIYFYKVTTADKATLDGQKTTVSAALINITSLQQNIASLKLILQSAEDQLSVTTAPPTQENIDLAKAQILSAQGQVDAAQAVVNNTVLFAPFGGQVDKDNVVVGSIASSNVPVITISNSNLEVDTSIPEIDIASTKIGQTANITLDAFGNNTVFPATIASIDTAPSIVNGISVYNAKLKFNNTDARIETGMTANINIISDTHKNVLLVPETAVIQQNGKYFVVIDKGNSQKSVQEVTIGLRDGKNIEIVSGLSLNEKVFAY